MPRKIVNIIQTLPNPSGSGGDLRNRAVHTGLAAVGGAVVLAVGDHLPAPGWHPRKKHSAIEADLPTSNVSRVMAEMRALRPDLIGQDRFSTAVIARAVAGAIGGYPAAGYRDLPALDAAFLAPDSRADNIVTEG